MTVLLIRLTPTSTCGAACTHETRGMGMGCTGETNRVCTDRCGRDCMWLFDDPYDGAKHFSGTQRRDSFSNARMFALCAWHCRARQFPCR